VEISAMLNKGCEKSCAVLKSLLCLVVEKSLVPSAMLNRAEKWFVAFYEIYPQQL